MASKYIMRRSEEALAFGNRVKGAFRRVGNDSFKAETSVLLLVR